MKNLVFTLLFILPLLGNAQTRITIIDRNAENQLLFDENNPQSLISLIKTNEIPTSSMPWEQAKRLRDKGFLKTAAFKVGPISDIAIANIYGEDSMAVENGLLQYVYPPRDTFYTDFHEVTRYLVYESMDEHSEYRINSISLAKKYESEGPYEIVGRCDYSWIDSLFHLFYKEQLSVNGLNSILNDGLWEELRKKQIDENPTTVKPVLNFNTAYCSNYYPYIIDLLQPGKIKTSSPYQNNETWLGACSKLDRFDRYGWELHYGYQNVYGFDGPQPDIPIASADGSDSMVIANGMMCFVYSPAEFIPTWIDTLPSKAFLLYCFGETKSNLKRILFTTGENNELLADLNCEDPRIDQYITLLSKANIELQKQHETTWKSVFLTALNSSRKYDPSVAKDLKKFKKAME